MDKYEDRQTPVYGVWADHSTLRRESLGPLFGRITIGLRGPVDERWRTSYSFVRKDSEQFTRLTVDPKNTQISFTFRSNESTSEVEALIHRIELLIELSNLHATAAAFSEKRRKTSA